MTRPLGLAVVRVFCDEQGAHGNPLGIMSDGAAYDDESALTIAASSGFSETVFIDDAATGRIRIYVPRARVPFAGHPLVGTAWFLRRQGHDVRQLLTGAGPVEARSDEAGATIVTRAGRGVPWTMVQVASPDHVDAADPAGEGRHDYVWAWIDEACGTIRARAFASVSGTVEDEATGGAAVQLADELARSLTIVQGRGSRIEVRRDGEDLALSGRVTLID